MGSRHDDHRSSRGSRGERGERGHSGHNGRDGKDGAPGEVGPAGKDGAKGERGEAGDTIIPLSSRFQRDEAGQAGSVSGVVLPVPGKLKNWILVATPFPFDVTFNLLINDKQALSLVLKKGEKRVSEKKVYVRADEGDVVRLETPGVNVSGFLSSILLEAK